MKRSTLWRKILVAYGIRLFTNLEGTSLFTNILAEWLADVNNSFWVAESYQQVGLRQLVLRPRDYAFVGDAKMAREAFN